MATPTKEERRAKLLAGRKKSKESAGSTGTGKAADANVLRLLLAAGSCGEGLTAAEIAAKINNHNMSKVRGKIRRAAEEVASRGGIVYDDTVTQNGTGYNRYFTIPPEDAELFTPEEIAEIKAEANGFFYKGDASDNTRPELKAIAGRFQKKASK